MHIACLQAACSQSATQLQVILTGQPYSKNINIPFQLKNRFFTLAIQNRKNWANGLSLPVGEGGRGLGVTRDTGSDGDEIHERVPRNSPHLFNLGAKEFGKMFFDGRVQIDFLQPSGFINPAGDNLPVDILTTPLAIQAMFPVTSTTEMAGQAGENPIADAAVKDQLAGENGVWQLLALRLQAIPGLSV